MPVFPDIDLEGLPLTLEAEIPESYIDVMGHMNVAWYTHLFSEATLGLYRHMGFEFGEHDERNQGSFALETHIRYFREVRLGDQVDVFTRLISRNEKRFHIFNIMRNRSRSEIAATYEMVATSVDLRRRRPSTIPEDIGQAMDAVIAAHNSLDWDPPLCGVMGPR